ncbi:MAG: zf-TFIIB domain-containing protein [Cyanobacteria bacterium P01_G01_bin.54]
MDCPKCRRTALLETTLPEGVAVQHCTECQGHWLPLAQYAQWQATHPPQAATAQVLNHPLPSFAPSPKDARAALCPECRRYLTRAKVEAKTPFFLERCNECEGYWCDRGEWEVLMQLGVSGALEQFFDSEWQMKFREQNAVNREQEQMLEKLGPELAQQVVELAQVLQQHPAGDYALAYLVRKAAHNDAITELRVES